VRVALDLAPTRLAGAGVARYTRGVEAALAARPDVEVLPLGGGPAPGRGTFRHRALVLRHDLAWYPLGLRRAARRSGADIVHLVTLRGPLTAGAPPSVQTVHDLALLHHPETLARWNRLYTRATLRRLLDAAAVVVADSADGADDLAHVAPRARVRVVHPGVAQRFFEPAPGPPPVDGPYVLFVGTPEPRKNLPRLVAAMRGRSERLVLVGAEGWGPEIETAPRVVRLGRVDDGTLHRLYAGAACLAIPSLHEGFGYPAAEAMAAGCAVLAARRGALPEVTGGAAILVDPTDVEAIEGGLEEAILHGDALRAAGRKRARDLTWERTANGLLPVYREAVGWG
jgi:glycosyltransferase involved in cell wall biosynthesis